MVEEALRQKRLGRREEEKQEEVKGEKRIRIRIRKALKMTTPLVRIVDAWFTRAGAFVTAGKSPRPVFSAPLSLTLHPKTRLAVVGDSAKTDLLAVLANRFVAHPVAARKFPASLTDTRFRTELLRFVNNGSWGHGANDSSGGFTHLSSRYEFFKDLEVDEIVQEFIANRSYNSNTDFDKDRVHRLVQMLHLTGLQGRFITMLSSGQFRRARIAKELYKEPSVLCIDDPFLGLDPYATATVDDVLRKTALDPHLKTTLVLGLRVQDDIPEWIDGVVIVDEHGIKKKGKKDDLLGDLARAKNEFHERHIRLQKQIEEKLASAGASLQSHAHNGGSNIIEMKNMSIRYKGVPTIKDLNWTVKEGEKWHIRGRNGSGKTTLLSLVTLDHPQSWNRSIKVFGVERAPGKVNYFDTNKYIGFTSPELHAIYPKNHTVFETISTGYIVGSYIPPRENLTAQQTEKIDRFLEVLDLGYLRDVKFSAIPVSKQKLVLLLRAIINNPKILILDEALSAMTDEDVIKGKALVDQLNTTCLVIGHVDEEIPKCDKYIVVNGARHGVYEIGDV